MFPETFVTLICTLEKSVPCPHDVPLTSRPIRIAAAIITHPCRPQSLSLIIAPPIPARAAFYHLSVPPRPTLATRDRPACLREPLSHRPLKRATRGLPLTS